MRVSGVCLWLLGAAACTSPPSAPATPPDFDSRWDFSDPAGSERLFRALLAEHADAAPRWRLELRTQVARALGLQMEFERALAELDAFDAGARAADERVRVRALLERGRVLRSRGEEGGPSPLFRAAWERARAAGEDGLAVDAAHMLALAPPPGETAGEWNARALELAESSDEEAARRWRGALWNNTGWEHHGAGEFDTALAAFERSRAAFAEDGRDDRARIARWAIARTLRSTGRYDEALERELEVELAARGEPDGYVFEEIAENLLALGRGDEAAAWFGTAWEELREDPWLACDEPERLARLERLAAR